MDKNEKQGEIGSAISSLETTLGVLRVRIDMIAERIAPILSSSGPKDEGKMDPTPEPSSLLARNIFEKLKVVDGFIEVCDDLLERIELP